MPQPYLDYVRRISREWSHLQVLVEFCNPKLKFGQQGGLVVAQRMEKIDVQVIDANTSADGIFSFQKAQHLKCWNDLQTWKKDFFQKPASQDCKHQVLIVEEISVALIEFLGHSFSLDPNFFLEHIQEMCRFGRGKSQLQWTGSHKAVVFPLNPYSDIQSQQFATLRYPRPYYIRSLHEVDAQRLRRNVPRLAWCTGEDTYSNEALSLYSGIECGQGLLCTLHLDRL